VRPARVVQVRSKYRDTEMTAVKQYRDQNKNICICHQGCTLFKPGQADNCEIAQASFELSQKVGVVLVHSCDRFRRS